MSLLEKIIRLIDILWVNWCCTCGCSLRPTFQLRSSLLDIMKKSKEIFQHLKKNYGLPPLVWFILGTNFQIPKNMFVLVQKYDTTQEGVMYCLLGVNIFWCKKKKSTPKQHNLKGCSVRNKVNSPKTHKKKVRLQFTTTKKTMILFFKEMSSCLMK